MPIVAPEKQFVAGCPSYERIDVFASPAADCDGDRLTNIVGLYRGLDPCAFDTALVAEPTTIATLPLVEAESTVEAIVADPVAGSTAAADAADVESPPPDVCPAYSFGDVLDDFEGDWDQDTLSNSFEMHNQLDPCTFDAVGPDVSVEPSAFMADRATTPCPDYAIEDAIADQYSDWDRDGILNGFEFYNNLNPCVGDERAPAWLSNFVPPAPDQSVTPCQIYSVEAILDDPDGDWDWDRVSNSFELYNNSDLCVYEECDCPSHGSLAAQVNAAESTNSLETLDGTILSPFVALVPDALHHRLVAAGDDFVDDGFGIDVVYGDHLSTGTSKFAGIELIEDALADLDDALTGLLSGVQPLAIAYESVVNLDGAGRSTHLAHGVSFGIDTSAAGESDDVIFEGDGRFVTTAIPANMEPTDVAETMSAYGQILRKLERSAADTSAEVNVSGRPFESADSTVNVCP